MFAALTLLQMALLGTAALVTLALAVIDLRTGYLPDILQLPLALVGAALLATGSPIGLGWEMALTGAMIGAGLFWFLRFVVTRIKGQEAMGLGDVKLAGTAGLWLGPFGLPWVMICAGALTLGGVFLASLITRRPLWRGEMPLGPGLALGIAGAFLWRLLDEGAFLTGW